MVFKLDLKNATSLGFQLQVSLCCFGLCCFGLESASEYALTKNVLDFVNLRAGRLTPKTNDSGSKGDTHGTETPYGALRDPYSHLGAVKTICEQATNELCHV